jgi:hypothetical protein
VLAEAQSRRPKNWCSLDMSMKVEVRSKELKGFEQVMKQRVALFVQVRLFGIVGFPEKRSLW